MASVTTSFLRPPVDDAPATARSWWRATAAAAASVIACAALGALPTGSARSTVLAWLVAATAVAVVAAVLRCVRASLPGRRRAALAVLAVAFTALAAGDCLRALGFADAAVWGAVAFYPCLLTGIALLPMAELTGQDLRRLALDAAIVLLGGSLVLGDVFAQAGNGDPLAGAMPLADLAALAALLWLVTGRRPGAVRGFAGWLAWSLVFLVLADIGSGWQAVAGRPLDERLFALGQTISLACAGLAAVRLGLAPGAQVIEGEARRVADSLAVCYGVLAAAVLVRLSQPAAMETAGATGLVAFAVLLALVLVRQALALHDHHRLYRELEALGAGMEERVRERTDDLRRQVAERERMEQAERSHRLMAEALSDTAAALASTIDLSEVLDRVLANVGRAAPHSAATVMFIEDGVARVVHHAGYAERGLGDWVEALAVPVESWPRLQEIAATGQAALQEDAAGDPGWAFFPQTAWVRCWLCAPLRAKNRVFGFISLVSDRERAFTIEHRERLMAFADQMGLALENARLFAQTRKRVERLSLLNEISARLNRIEGLAAVLDDVVARMPPTLAAARVTLGVLSADQLRFAVVADHGRLASPSYTGSAIERAPFADAGLLDGPDLVVIRDPASDVRMADPRLDRLRLSLVRDRVTALLITPVRLHGHLHGLLVVQSDQQAQAFSASDGELVRTAANLFAARIEIDRVLEAERAARTGAEEASRLKSEFLANTSHELRTPLTGILLSLELAADGTLEDVQRSDLMETAQLSGQRLLGTINGLLDLAKIEAGRLDVHAERIDPVRAAATVIDALRGTALRIGIGLELAGWTSGAPRNAWADPTLLHQILTNLVGNALKFTERGGVVVSLSAAGDRVRIRIADTGVGISQEQIARLFQPFVQADGSSTRRFEGTGLGLVIARRMAERMGGSLTLDSDGPGAGTVAEVELPAA